MRIGEVAATSGVPAKTLRFWEEQRLLPPALRSPAGYRAYGAEVIDRIGFIRRGQAAGFSLAQIRQVLEITDSGTAPCRHVGELIAERLAAIEARIAELEAARAHLRFLERRAALQDPSECHGYCAILEPARAGSGAP